MTGTTRALTTLALVCVVAATAFAQRFRLPEGPGVPVRFPPADFHDGGFTHCKIMYTSVRREANGLGWSTDYALGVNAVLYDLTH